MYALKDKNIIKDYTFSIGSVCFVEKLQEVCKTMPPSFHWGMC